MPLVSFIYLNRLRRQSSTYPRQKHLSHRFVHVSTDGTPYNIRTPVNVLFRVWCKAIYNFFPEKGSYKKYTIIFFWLLLQNCDISAIPASDLPTETKFDGIFAELAQNQQFVVEKSSFELSTQVKEKCIDLLELGTNK